MDLSQLIATDVTVANVLHLHLSKVGYRKGIKLSFYRPSRKKAFSNNCIDHNYLPRLNDLYSINKSSYSLSKFAIKRFTTMLFEVAIITGRRIWFIPQPCCGSEVVVA